MARFVIFMDVSLLLFRWSSLNEGQSEISKLLRLHSTASILVMLGRFEALSSVRLEHLLRRAWSSDWSGVRSTLLTFVLWR